MQSGYSILVIQHSEAAPGVKEGLQLAGYRIAKVVGSVQEALSALGEVSPDLILIDSRRRDLHSAEGLQKIQHEFGIPVAHLTAYEDGKPPEPSREIQAIGFIEKPIATGSLRRFVETALSKHRDESGGKERKDWLCHVLAALPDPVLVTDAAGRICYLNGAAQELTACNIDEALGRPSTEVLHFIENGLSIGDLVPVVMLQGEAIAFPQEACLRVADNRSYAIEGVAAPLFCGEQAEGVVFLFRDVTLRKLEEEKVKLEDTHAALSLFAIGIASLLEPKLSAIAEEGARVSHCLVQKTKLHTSAEAIRNAAVDAFATLNLCTLWHQVEVELQPVRLSEIVGRVEEAWRRAFPVFVLQLDPDSTKLVRADAVQLTRALDIVLRHALDRKDIDSGLGVATCCGPEGLDDWLRIRVAYSSSDENASGHACAFDPFWGGGGQDLRFARLLVSRMGGLLRARTESTNTVIFEFFLRCAEAERGDIQLDCQQEHAILLIEPHSEMRRILHAHFEQHGYHVLGTGNCEEALFVARLYAGPIQVVIANPAKDDPWREELAQALQTIRGGTQIRLFEGYREECSAEVSRGSDETFRYLTKWHLLEWANQSVKKTRTAAAAN